MQTGTVKSAKFRPPETSSNEEKACRLCRRLWPSTAIGIVCDSDMHSPAWPAVDMRYESLSTNCNQTVIAMT